MARSRRTHLSQKDVKFGREIADMIELRLAQAEALMDLAREQKRRLQWSKYEEDFDERVKRFLNK